MSAATATKPELKPAPVNAEKAEPGRRGRPTTTGRLDVRTDHDLVKLFEAVALLQGQSATELVVSFMRDTVDRHTKAVARASSTPA